MKDHDAASSARKTDLGRCWPGCCDAPGGVGSDDELRCECGCLLARLVANGLELKCRRCRRIIVIPLTVDASTRLTAIHTRARHSLLTAK
jgi:phage FluMu protein Com